MLSHAELVEACLRQTILRQAQDERCGKEASAQPVKKTDSPAATYDNTAHCSSVSTAGFRTGFDSVTVDVAAPASLDHIFANGRTQNCELFNNARNEKKKKELSWSSLNLLIVDMFCRNLDPHDPPGEAEAAWVGTSKIS